MRVLMGERASIEFCYIFWTESLMTIVPIAFFYLSEICD